MEIKDITGGVERMEEVRGGRVETNLTQVGTQVGGNVATSSASGWGIGNSTQSGVVQIAPQSLQQSASVEALDIDVYETTISNSLVGFSFI